MASDWWSRKLSTPTASTNAPQQGGIMVPQQPVVQRPVVPQQQYVNQGLPPTTHQPAVPGRQEVLDPNRPGNAEISMGEAMRLWQGGEAARKEGNLSCPECGSKTGYTMYSANAAGAAKINGQPPRPHCFECGYNGSFTQGLETSWA